MIESVIPDPVFRFRYSGHQVGMRGDDRCLKEKIGRNVNVLQEAQELRNALFHASPSAFHQTREVFFDIDRDAYAFRHHWSPTSSRCLVATFSQVSSFEIHSRAVWPSRLLSISFSSNSASPEAIASLEGDTSRPVTRSVTTSGIPPTSVARIALPRAIALSSESGKPSCRDTCA